jgi:hypothetical protein
VAGFLDANSPSNTLDTIILLLLHSSAPSFFVAAGGSQTQQISELEVEVRPPPPLSFFGTCRIGCIVVASLQQTEQTEANHRTISTVANLFASDRLHCLLRFSLSQGG